MVQNSYPPAKSLPLLDAQEALSRVSAALAAADLPAPQAIGHRIVHGGPALQRHCRIDAAVLQHLAAAAELAPLHAPRALALIEQTQSLFPGVPQVACFDTCFHAELPDVARLLPLARELQFPEIRRYGFHGLSCESIVAQLAPALPARLIIAHLGNGASVTAVSAGRSLDTTMGLTPTGGLLMGTRSGDLDPGVLFYLLREKGFKQRLSRTCSIAAPACSASRGWRATCASCDTPKLAMRTRRLLSKRSATPSPSR